MKKILTLLTALIVVTALSAKNYPNKAVGVTVSIPNNWTVETDTGYLEAMSPNEAVALMFFELEADNVDAALDELEAVIDEMVDELTEEGEPEEFSHNGMEGIYADAAGIIEGEPVSLGLMLLESPKGKMILVLGLSADNEMTPKDEAALEKIFDSLKPL
jgi:hypothetical protein